MTHSVVLLNDGTSQVLLNDGTSLLLLNAEGVGHGVDIQGIHPIVDLRGFGAGRKPKRKSRQICIMVNGKISCIFPMPTKGKLFRQVETKFQSQISRIFNSKTLGKLWKSKHFETRFRLDKKTRIKIFGERQAKIFEKLKESKLKKMKKLFDAYKESQDE